MKSLKWFFLVTDIGFIVYWTITAVHLIPKEVLFKDYDNPILMAWNWSFLPLDLFISATGLASLHFFKQNRPQWRSLALISLILTFCSGLQAIAFWVIRNDYNLAWWLPNLFLFLYPLFFIPRLMMNKEN